MRKHIVTSLLSAITLGLAGCDSKNAADIQQTAFELKAKLAGNITFIEFLVLAEKLPATEELHKEFAKLLENSKDRYEDLTLLASHSSSTNITKLCSFSKFRCYTVYKGDARDYNDESRFLTDPVKKALFSIESEVKFSDVLYKLMISGAVSPDVGAFYQASHAALMQEKHRNNPRVESEQAPKPAGSAFINYRADWAKKFAAQKNSTTQVRSGI